MTTKIIDTTAARRCARAIASDILLYNPEKVVEGIEQDSIFDVLKEEIEEGREYFHALAAVSEKYNSAHCDKQYNYCLKKFIN